MQNGAVHRCVNASDVRRSNWLRYVNCARNYEEQNLMAYQHEGGIFYRACKDIAADVELLVWYDDQYAGDQRTYSQPASPKDSKSHWCRGMECETKVY